MPKGGEFSDVYSAIVPSILAVTYKPFGPQRKQILLSGSKVGGCPK